MIQVIGGEQGSGKSLYAAWIIQQACLRGETVATNIELTPRHPFYDQVCYIGTDEYPILDQHAGKAFFNYFDSRTRFVIDEADIWFDSEDWGKLKGPMKWYFKQHGKRGDNVHLIVQDFDNLWVRARRMVHEWVYCYRDGPLNSPFGFFADWLLPTSFQCFRRETYKNAEMQKSKFIREGKISIEEAAEMYGWYLTEQQFVGLEWT